MPLIKSGSKAAVSTNIKEMMEAGHPQKQAVAAALSNARKYGAKYQFGGALPMRGMPWGGQAPAPAAPADPMAGPTLGGGAFSPSFGPQQFRPPTMPMGGMGQQLPWFQNQQGMNWLSRFRPGMGGMARGGVPRMQSGGLPIMPWFARNEARNISHGFLHSVVPGRTDKLPTSVAGGSYILPAAHIAALGQDNSIAGAAKVSKMFNLTPAGTPPMRAGRSFHMPNLPKPMRIPKMASGGMGKPTDVVLSGGEYILHPDAIIRKYGSLEKGHRELDKWVMDTRKRHIKTLRNLLPPKKS